MRLPLPADRKPIQKYIQRGFLLPLGVGAPLPRAPAATPSVGPVPRVPPRRLPPLRAVVALRRPLGRRVLPPCSVCPAACARVSLARPPPARGWGAGIRLPPMRGVSQGCWAPLRPCGAYHTNTTRCRYRTQFHHFGNIAHYHFVTFSRFSIVNL